jgi:hypothetical protein
MGYVATLVINCDALHLIKEDKDFGDKVYHAVNSLDTENNICVGGFISAATAIEIHHSSYAVPVLVGGHIDKKITCVGVNYNAGENTELEVLKQLAVKHGFSLRKKSKKKV